MTEFIKTSAAVGIFTLYAFLTGIPGLVGYHFLKHTTADKPIDKEAIWKNDKDIIGRLYLGKK